MKFNNYLWDLYKSNSKSLENDKELLFSNASFEDANIYFTCFEADSNYEPLSKPKEIECLVDLVRVIKDFAKDEEATSIDEAEEIFRVIADDRIDLYSGDDFYLPDEDKDKKYISYLGGGIEHERFYQTDIISNIEHITLGLHQAYPQFFFPYLFVREFNRLNELANFFDIKLPSLPKKRHKRDRAFYYLEVNRIFQDLRAKLKLSPTEFNFFIYDFGLKNLESLNTHSKTKENLPNPSRAWLIIGYGTGIDAEFLNNLNEETVTQWQGKIEMRVGDIVLMYQRNPKSSLHSIWRVVESGFNDPYAFHYAQTKIGYPIEIPKITFKEIRENEILGLMPIVKASFQGATGSTFSLSEYNEVLKLINSKNPNIRNLPHLPIVEELKNIEISNERDVEINLLEPLLEKLGFANNEWIRQFPVRMGRGQRNYPDYVYGGDPTHGEETAKALIECKYHIDRDATLTDTFKQAKSYALRLRAKLFALADKQGIWIFRYVNDDFNRDVFEYMSWVELLHHEKLHELSLFIGKEFIEDHCP